MVIETVNQLVYAPWSCQNQECWFQDHLSIGCLCPDVNVLDIHGKYSLQLIQHCKNEILQSK